MLRKLFPLTAVLAVGLPMFGSTLDSYPTCTAGTLASYVSMSGPCTFGSLGGADLTISSVNFAAVSLGAVPATLATAAQINVTPPASATGSFEFTSSLFKLDQAGQHVQYSFTYVIDPPPPVIPGFDMEMLAESPVAPGKATIDVALCPGGLFPCTSPITFQLVHNGGPGCDICSFSVKFDPTNILSVGIRLDLDTTKGGTSQIDGFSTTVVTPEPGSILLAGLGVTALGLLRVRRRR